MMVVEREEHPLLKAFTRAARTDCAELAPPTLELPSGRLLRVFAPSLSLSK